MSAWSRSAVVLAVLAALAVPASAPAHVGSSSVAVDDAAKRKKAKKNKCKRGKVRVKVGRRVSCRPLKRAFPRPKKGDPRKLFTNFVYGKDWSKYRTRRGKRLPSLPKLIRKTGRGAPALLARATARGLARLDAMEGAAAVRAAARAGPAATGCPAQAPRQSDRFTQGGGGGGPSASVGVSYGPDGASMGIELTGNDISVSADIDMGLCDPNEVEAPSCPTAVGKLEGLIRYKLKVNIMVTRGGTNVWSQGMDVTRRTKLVGWNEVDAKLDQLDIEDLETSNFTLGGSTRGYPPVHIRTKLERRTQVDMRSGSYDPGRSNVEVTINMDGLFGPDRDEAEGEAERKAREDGDRQFRAVVEKAISGYRSREDGWQRPTCADLRLNAAKNTLTLRGGASGTFTATAIAKADGQASELDARLSEMQNAIFSPTRAGGQRAQFGYSNVVGSAPPGSKVRVKVRATSKGGVAEGIWEQRLVPPFEINEIAGNFSGEFTRVYSIGTATVTWTGSGTFVRQTPAGIPGATGNYILKAGIASFHYSGQTITEHADCDMSGSAVVDLFQHGGGSIGVSPVNFSKPFDKGPHTYGGLVSLGPDPMVTLTMVNCIPEAEDEEGEQYTLPVGFPPLDTGDEQRQSPDAIQYNGSHTESQSGITTSWTWAMTGRKTP